MKELPPEPRVADVAAGTGAWALHAADILSDDAQVVAYDISSAQFPTSSPANVRFIVADARQPFPLEDHGSFDHVHVCAVVAAMRPQHWKIVMRNVVQLLKPTGTLQWTEADWNNLRCLRDRNDAEVMPWRAIPRLLETFSARMDDKISESIGRLRQTVVDHFDHVEIDVVSSDRFPEHRASSTRAFLGGMLSWAERAEVLPFQELQKLKPEVEAEIDKGNVTVRIDFEPAC